MMENEISNMENMENSLYKAWQMNSFMPTFRCYAHFYDFAIQPLQFVRNDG